MNNNEEKELKIELRDYFAAAALQGLLASGYRLPTHAARDAFNQADAMLQARKEGALHLKTKGEKP